MHETLAYLDNVVREHGKLLHMTQISPAVKKTLIDDVAKMKSAIKVIRSTCDPPRQSS